MLKNVIVLVADEAYIPHVKSVMVNCVKQGEWTGDFCLVLPPDVDIEYFESRGIYVLTDPEPTYYRKFAIFDQYFNQEYMTEWETPEYKWDRVLYLDADVLVQAPLEPLMHEDCWGSILADREMFTLEYAFTHWAKAADHDPSQGVQLLNQLSNICDLSRYQYNTGILLYNPRTLLEIARERLRDMRESLAPINTHVGKGTDQPIINLVFYNKFNRVRSDMFCYWRSAWDKTIIIHYCSGYAPWIKKTEKMSAYFNDKLGRPCHDIYLENLDNFEKVFPVK